MIWQDVVMMITGIVFAISLVPQVYHGYKDKEGVIKKRTSVPTFIGLFVMSYAMFTLELYLSASVTFVTAFMWLILCWQRIKYSK